MGSYSAGDKVRRKARTTVIVEDVLDADGVTPEVPSTPGCFGVIKAVREETTMAAAESREKALMYQVLWDNGTLSYLGPDMLEVVK